MLTATATREEARQSLAEARQKASELASTKIIEDDGSVVVEPSDSELEALRFLVEGQARVITF